MCDGNNECTNFGKVTLITFVGFKEGKFDHMPIVAEKDRDWREREREIPIQNPLANKHHKLRYKQFKHKSTSP